MTTEERLVTALRGTDEYEPSPDLWSRVLYSIEEDEAHRRRVWRTAGAVVALVAVIVIVGFFSTFTTARPEQRIHLEWRTLEAMETIVLAGLVLALGPAIRRFGRGYASELFSTSPATANRLLRLLDIAYYLVFAGYVLLTARFEAPVSYIVPQLGLQIYEGLARVAGLLLAMGLLHGITFTVLPLVALVFNSTRARRSLPRWVTFLVVIGSAAAAFLVILMLLGLGSPA